MIGRTVYHFNCSNLDFLCMFIANLPFMPISLIYFYIYLTFLSFHLRFWTRKALCQLSTPLVHLQPLIPVDAISIRWAASFRTRASSCLLWYPCLLQHMAAMMWESTRMESSANSSILLWITPSLPRQWNSQCVHHRTFGRHIVLPLQTALGFLLTSYRSFFFDPFCAKLSWMRQ